jgi:geranylgeranyl pyrophosphate synthase
MSYKEEFEKARLLAEERLDTFFNSKGLEEAMKYSLMAGGKRIRPILAMKFCEASGGTMEEALNYGCGVEMLHTYSLIHDDLPCMDNDDLRRGRPTCHKVYGECIATLAGDALQASAFGTILHEGDKLTGERKAAALNAAKELSDAVGELGMCGGQYWDTVGDGKVHSEEELTDINDKKTGALLRAACVIGVYAASGHRDVPESCVEAARQYATNLGLAFQIRDDILDVISTTDELGKPVLSDESNEKSTYMSLLGLKECEARVEMYTERAKNALDSGDWAGDTEFLKNLADALAERKY